MRTNFHGLAIDSALVRLDLDKLLCSVCFDTKLQHNRKLCFHDWIILGIIAVVLGFVKQALDCEYVPRLLGSYFKEKGIQFGAEHLFHFLTRHVAFIQSCRKGKDFFFTSKSLPENYRANSRLTRWTHIHLFIVSGWYMHTPKPKVGHYLNLHYGTMMFRKPTSKSSRL